MVSRGPPKKQCGGPRKSWGHRTRDSNSLGWGGSPYSPDGFISRWWRRPMRCLVTVGVVAVAVGVGVAVTGVGVAVTGDGDVVGTGVAVAAVAVCWVTLNVAAIATPFPSRVTVNGLVSPKFAQLRLV